jgi:hypothetical protein
MSWVRVWLCELQTGCIRLAAVSDKAYQLVAHGRRLGIVYLFFQLKRELKHPENILDFIILDHCMKFIGF